MTELESDLAPIYGPKTEISAGVRRETLTELRVFFKQRLDMLERIDTGCADCAHKSGVVCKHWKATMPDGYHGRDCDAWQWCGVPF